MELLDKGKHCDEEFCHQLDYLPIKCKACSKSFCKYHIRYDDHNCKEANKFNYKIPTCPICNKTIEFKRGKDLDICLAEHMQICQEDMSNLSQQMNKVKLKNNENKIYKHKCTMRNCKSKEIIQFECQNCHNNFCIKHRMREDHNCMKKAASNLTFKTCSQEYEAATAVDNNDNIKKYEKHTVKNY